ncbi:hypothetical protein BJX96DRAFT_178309 [Aspergillus floccosus]
MAALATDAKFHMPDEGHVHKRTVMAWPGHNNPNYQEDGSLWRMKKEISAIAKAISNFEAVTLLVDCEQAAEAQRMFSNAGQYGVEVNPIGMDNLEPWMRDVAPTFVCSEHSETALYGVDFNFNGWGGRYPSISSKHLARQFLMDRNIPRVESSIVVEGGALELDGEGTLLATESSILNPNRNPNVTRETIEQELHRVLGVSKVIWVPGVRDQDVTDAHIDALVRFAAPGKVVMSRPTADNDVWMNVYNATRHVLLQSTDAKGRRFVLIVLPEADVNDLGVAEADMVTGYVNYLLVNGGIIAPRFGTRKADAKAKEILQNLFPDRQLVQVYLNEVGINGGGIHCMTQQIPVCTN